MPESTTTPQAPRIAIRFGAAASNSSKATNGARKLGQPQPPSALGKRPRPHALGHDSDSDQEDDSNGRLETVTTIGSKNAEDRTQHRNTKTARTESKPLVIACQTEGVWKAAARGKKGGQLLPHERESAFKGQDAETEPADQDKQVQWGLSVTKKPTLDAPSKAEQDNSIPEAEPNSENEESDAQAAPRTAEQDAMDALLGNDTKRKTKLVISESDNPKDEFQAAVEAAGEVSTLEEYDQIPDGEFGMAMLRGMGFDGKKQGTRPKEVRRRPALLGLGAKEDEEIKKAELAKKHGHRDRPPRLDEYRRGEAAKRQLREEKYSNSYKHERERERNSHGSSRRHDNRDRDRDRYRDRDDNSQRHRDRHSRH